MGKRGSKKSRQIDELLGQARALEAAGSLVAAEQSYRQALELDPASDRVLLGLSSVLISLERGADAEAVLRTALRHQPADRRLLAALEHNLGVAAKLQGRYEDGLVHYARAAEHAPELAIIDYNRGHALQHLGRVEEAIDSYRLAIAKDPSYLDAHHDLNALLFRLKRDEAFLRSYDDAAKKMPQSSALLLHKGRFLTQCGRYEEAREAFTRAVAIEPANSNARNALAGALVGLKAFDAATAQFEEALRLAPGSTVTRVNFATALLQAGEAKRARLLVRDAVARAPFDQQALAVLEIAQRAVGEAQDDTLREYEQLIQVFDLEPPSGFAGMAEFNLALNACLDALHTDAREHSDQTLRGGTQTFGRLFSSGHDLVDRLRSRIEEAVAAYIDRMGRDETHPLFGRRRDGFAFADSWSSRLHDCGFHTNHIHPKGWISSCYYVSVPDVAADAEAQQGWLKLGEPPFEAGLTDPIRRVVQPKPGRLVLFPSYMWHGTIAFRAGQARTTIAFDAIPQ
jgi:tetratricopeptide (TPR) repeat protein